MGFLGGRTNRATYWFSLGVVAALTAILIVAFHVQFKVSEVVLIMVCIPRLHDLGRSGWLAVGVYLTELAVILGAVFLAPDAETYEIAAGAMVLVIAGLLIWLGCIPGEQMFNRFGFQPKPGIGFPKS